MPQTKIEVGRQNIGIGRFVVLRMVFIPKFIQATKRKPVKMEHKRAHVLYVDDEFNNLMAFKAAFRRDFEVFLASSAYDGMKIMAAERIDVVISDQRMPEMTGVEFLEFVKNKYPDPMRMLLTGYADLAAVVDAINKGQVYRYLTKPWDENDLRLTILQAFEVYSLTLENRRLLHELKAVNRRLEEALQQQGVKH